MAKAIRERLAMEDDEPEEIVEDLNDDALPEPEQP